MRVLRHLSILLLWLAGCGVAVPTPPPQPTATATTVRAATMATATRQPAAPLPTRSPTPLSARATAPPSAMTEPPRLTPTPPVVATEPAPSPTGSPSPTATFPPTPPPQTTGVVLPDAAPEIVVPPGFRVWRWAALSSAPTALAWGSGGRLLVTTFDGSVLSLEDRDGDGLAEAPQTVATGIGGALGIAWRHGTNEIYVSRMGGVDRLVDDDGDGQAERREKVVDGLPVGRHTTDDVEFGPDGWLYIATGSVDDRAESGSFPRLQASILRVRPDGSGLEQYASGLRNPYGIAFDSAGRLWATDNGGDLPEGQPDELNLIAQGGRYGWPGCFGSGNEYIEDACAGTIAPVVPLAPHSSSDGLVVYEKGPFPSRYHGGLFIAQWGSAFEDKPAGRALVFVADPAGAATVTTFATGFQHPIDVKVAPDGALIVAEFGGFNFQGSPAAPALYRIAWVGAP